MHLPEVLAVRVTGYQALRRWVVELRERNPWKMDLELEANVQNQNRSKRRKDESSRMKAFIGRAAEYVGNGTANNGTYDAQRNCPKKGHVDMHHRFGNHPCD